MAQDSQKLVLGCEMDAFLAALAELQRYSELCEAAQQRVMAFLSGLERPIEVASVNQNRSSAMGTVNLFLVFKPSDLLLEFLAAMAVDFDFNIIK